MSDDAVSVLESVADFLCSHGREGAAELLRAIGVEYSRRGAEIEQLTTIVEIIMTQHWDMAACKCWICCMGREAGCHPREEHLRWRGTYAFARMEDE